MVSARTAILEYVCPALGVVTGNVMFSAPIRATLKANRHGSLGDLNPTPWAMMTGNCCGWVIYSFIIQNYFVFFANAPGFMISVWLNLCAVKLQYQDHCAKEMRKSFVQFINENRASFSVPSATGGKHEEEQVEAVGEPMQQMQQQQQQQQQQRGLTDIGKIVLQVTTQEIHAPAPHERIVVAVVFFWLIVTTLVCFLDTSQETREMLVGIVVNANLVFFYGAPLSTIFTVLKTRNSASIHRWLLIASTFNGVFWSSYGWAVWDLYIGIPNFLGALLGVIQVVLVLVFPRRRARDSSLCDEEKEEEDEIEIAVVKLDLSSSQEEATHSNEEES